MTKVYLLLAGTHVAVIHGLLWIRVGYLKKKSMTSVNILYSLHMYMCMYIYILLSSPIFT
jgi:hypothetical protein